MCVCVMSALLLCCDKKSHICAASDRTTCNLFEAVNTRKPGSKTQNNCCIRIGVNCFALLCCICCSCIEPHPGTDDSRKRSSSGTAVVVASVLLAMLWQLTATVATAASTAVL